MGNKASKAKTPGDGGTVAAPPTSAPPVTAPVADAPQEVAPIADGSGNTESKPAEATHSEPASPATDKPLSPEEKKLARKSQRAAKEQEKEKEKQEKKRKEKEEKAAKEAEKRMVASSKRKSVKSTRELRQESHEKVADVVAFLNDVEKGKTEEDPIAMLDSLIEEDKNAKAAEAAPVTDDPIPVVVEPAEEGPRDLVAMLEKLQKLIEDPQMLQRLEELVGQKLTSESDPTKLKSMSNEEIEKLELAMARDSEWAKRRRAEREEEVKTLTSAVSLADKRKSYLATSSGSSDQVAVEKKPAAQVALPSGAGSIAEKRRSLMLNNNSNNNEVHSALKHSESPTAKGQAPGSLRKQIDSPAPKGQAPGSLRKAVDTPPVAELKSAMKKGDSPVTKRRGIQFAESDEPEEKKTPSGKRMPLEGRNKVQVDESSPKKVAADASPAPQPVKKMETEEERAKRESDEKEAQEKLEKEAENKANLAAYKLELEEKKRRSTSEMRRRAMAKLENSNA